MALTEQEKKELLELKAEGYSFEEALGHIGGSRFNRPTSVSIDRQAYQSN